MNLAVVPYVVRPDPVDPTGRSVLRVPDLPAAILTRRAAWGQASSDLVGRGSAVVWLDVSAGEVAEIARRPGARVIEGAMTRAELRRMRTALDAERAPDPGRRFGARDEFVAAYRELAGRVEREERARRVADGLGRLALWIGVPLAAHLLLRDALAPGVALALTAIASDRFAALSGGASLDGTTMDAGLGGDAHTWAAASGIIGTTLSGDKMLYRSGSGFAYAYDSTMTDTARLRVSAMIGVAGCGPAARLSTSTTAPNGYALDSTGTPQLRLLRLDSGARTALAYGSVYSVFGDAALDCDGTSISGLLAGVTDAGPVTDATHATGRAGVQMYESNYLDEFLAQTADVASGHPAVRRVALCGFRPVEIGRSGVQVM